MARRKPLPLPETVIDYSQPCKNGQPLVRADGSCLRCGADQGVHGYACDFESNGRARTAESQK